MLTLNHVHKTEKLTIKGLLVPSGLMLSHMADVNQAPLLENNHIIKFSQAVGCQSQMYAFV